MVQRKEGAENGVASWGGPGGNTAQTRGLSGGRGAADPGGRAGVLCLEGTHLNRCGSDGNPGMMTAGTLCLPEPNRSVVNTLGLPRWWASRWLLQRALVDEKGLGKDGRGCRYPLSSRTGLWSSHSRKVSSRGCSNIPGDGAPHHKGPPALFFSDACLFKSLILSQHLLLLFFFKKNDEQDESERRLMRSQDLPPACHRPICHHCASGP